MVREETSLLYSQTLRMISSLGTTALTMVHQVVQELHLFRGHVNRLAAFARFRTIEIDIHVTEMKAPHRNPRLFADAPKQRLHPRHQLRRIERFGEIVVGAEFQPHHAIGHLGARGEHQDGAVHARLAHFAAHIEAHLLRQHHVEDDKIEPPLGSARQARIAVARRLHLVPLHRQKVSDRLH